MRCRLKKIQEKKKIAKEAEQKALEEAVKLMGKGFIYLITVMLSRV